MNETRFTSRAQTALRLAQGCASELGHGYVGTEHLLLGLARDGKGVAAQVLRGVGLDAARLKEHIAQLVGVGDSGSRPSQWLTPRCKRVIELALMEIPQEYQKPVLRKVITDKWPVNIPAGKNLPGYWKKRFLYRVAKNKHFIE